MIALQLRRSSSRLQREYIIIIIVIVTIIISGISFGYLLYGRCRTCSIVYVDTWSCYHGCYTCTHAYMYVCMYVCKRELMWVPRKGVWTSVNMRVWTCKPSRVEHDFRELRGSQGIGVASSNWSDADDELQAAATSESPLLDINLHIYIYIERERERNYYTYIYIYICIYLGSGVNLRDRPPNKEINKYIYIYICYNKQ